MCVFWHFHLAILTGYCPETHCSPPPPGLDCGHGWEAATFQQGAGRPFPAGPFPAATTPLRRTVPPSLPPPALPSRPRLGPRSTAQEPLRCPGHFHSPGECMCWVCLFSRGFFLIRIETGVENPASRAEAGAGALSRPSRPHSAPSVGLRAARQTRCGLVVALGPLTHSVCHARPSRCRPAEAFSAGARPARDAPSARAHLSGVRAQVA